MSISRVVMLGCWSFFYSFVAGTSVSAETLGDCVDDEACRA
ncbi:MAG TPA: hypothetical protein VE820_06465 [Sphingomicrobium sp.]|nr:hypothetical protein [Sphingomicrobium sp.]